MPLLKISESKKVTAIVTLEEATAKQIVRIRSGMDTVLCTGRMLTLHPS